MSAADTAAPAPAHDDAAPAAVAGEPARDRALRRYPDRGILGGVCAGVAQLTGIDVALVRLVGAMVVVAGGIGVAIYALAWAIVPAAPESEAAPRRPGWLRRAGLMVLTVAGAFVVLRLSGLRFGDAVVWPLVVGACGMALAWRLTAGATTSDDPMLSGGGRLRRAGWAGAPRFVVAALLIAFVTSALLHTFGLLHNVGKEAIAAAIVATTLVAVVGPWVVRLGGTLHSERAARIREQERAELAAHLHDSVLQTLALIQKRAGEPLAVTQLARRQERELRRWLFQRSDGQRGDSARAALERAAAEVEELHGVPVEAVIVGEQRLDARLEALIAAAREAMTNAAKFARSDHVDLYAELGDARVEVFVRDRGCGFDLDAIPADRRGVRDSIIGRVERHHGRAAVRSTPGEGTEVELVLDRAAVA
jgi:signal transduction histidine kinase/phage shock protein PspC (stress-responsive transcriptional regulator)